MGNTQTKIVLGGLSDEDADIMAREIMRGDIDLTKPKPGITTPVVVDEVPFWLESESSSEGHASSTSSSDSYATGGAVVVSEGASATYAVVNGTWVQQQAGTGMSVARSVAQNTSMSTVRTEGTSTSFANSHGRSQTLKPIREERPTHFYSLEESLHLANLKIRNLPDRAAIVKRRGRRTVQVETIEVKPVLDYPKGLKRFRDTTFAKSRYVSPSGAAQAEIDARQVVFLGPPASVKTEEDFWAQE